MYLRVASFHEKISNLWIMIFLNKVSKISLKSFLKIMFEVGPHYKKHSKNRWCNKYYCCLFPFILLFQQLFLILLCYQYVSVCVIIIVESILNPLQWWKLRPCPYPLFFLQIQWLRWEFKLKGSQILFQGLNPYFLLVLNWKGDKFKSFLSKIHGFHSPLFKYW